MRKWFIFSVSSFGCVYLFIQGGFPIHKDMPPNTRLVYDGHRYCIMWHMGGFWIPSDERFPGLPMWTKQSAINEAWSQYNFEEGQRKRDERRKEIDNKWIELDNH